MRKLIPAGPVRFAFALATLCEARRPEPAPSAGASTLTRSSICSHRRQHGPHLRCKCGIPAFRIWTPVSCRQVIAKNPIGGGWGIWLNTRHSLGNLRWVYDHPSASAQQIRNELNSPVCASRGADGIAPTLAVKDPL